jgi:outer membrane protein OmpA-like peptidoglycan-associated protein
MKNRLLLTLTLLLTFYASQSQILDSLRLGAESVKYKVIASSSFEDFGANPYDGKLLFVSSRGTNLLSAKYDLNNQKFFDLYLYDFKSGEVSPYEAQLLSIADAKYHFGPTTLLPDSSGIVLSRNYRRPNVQDEVNFYLIHEDFNKGTSKKLPFITMDFSFQHPFYDAPSRRLYFSANLPEGPGGYDIYYSEFLKDSTWGDPVLVADVNGPRDDVFPTIGADRKLYFSRTVNQQGLDLFTFDFKTGISESFEAPMATSKDEFALVAISADSAVFSQSQNGRFNTDLILAWVDLSESPIVENFAVIIPVEEGKDAWATLDSLNKALGSDKLYVAEVNGKPVVVYEGKQVPKEKAEKMREDALVFGVASELTKNPIKPLERPAEKFHVVYPVDGSLSVAYTQLDEWKDRTGETELWLGEIDGQLVFVITTDKLEDEAETKKQWAIREGMLGTYLTKEPIQPLARPADDSYSTIAGVFESPKGALKHIEKVSPWAPESFISLYKGRYYVVSADYTRKEKAIENRDFAVENGIEDAWLLPEKLFPIVLPNLDGSPDLIVYFRFDKYDVMDKFAKQIDDVMAQLPDNVQRVYMVGHTDSRGTNAYNEVLSTNRVNEVAKYIAENYPEFKATKELDARGEKELTNKCGDGVECDPYAHYLNRRVEIWFY